MLRAPANTERKSSALFKRYVQEIQFEDTVESKENGDPGFQFEFDGMEEQPSSYRQVSLEDILSGDLHMSQESEYKLDGSDEEGEDFQRTSSNFSMASKTDSIPIKSLTMQETEWDLLNTLIDSRPRSRLSHDIMRTFTPPTSKSPQREFSTVRDVIRDTIGALPPLSSMNMGNHISDENLQRAQAERGRKRLLRNISNQIHSTLPRDTSITSRLSDPTDSRDTSAFSPILFSSADTIPRVEEDDNSLQSLKDFVSRLSIAPRRRTISFVVSDRETSDEQTALQRLISQIYNGANEFVDQLYIFSVSKANSVQDDLLRMEKLIQLLHSIPKDSRCNCKDGDDPYKECPLFMVGFLRFYGIHDVLSDFISSSHMTGILQCVSFRIACLFDDFEHRCKSLIVNEMFERVLSMDLVELCTRELLKRTDKVDESVVEVLFQVMVGIEGQEASEDRKPLEKVSMQKIVRPKVYPSLVRTLARVSAQFRCKALEAIVFLVSWNPDNIVALTLVPDWIYYMVPLLLPHPSTLFNDTSMHAYSNEECEIAFRYQINILSAALTYRLHNSTASSQFRNELETILALILKHREEGGADLCRVLLFSLLHRMQKVSPRDVEILQGKSTFPHNQIVVIQTLIECIMFPKKEEIFELDDDLDVPDNFLIEKAVFYIEDKLDHDFFDKLPKEFYRSSEIKKIVRKMQKDLDLLQSIHRFIKVSTTSMRASEGISAAGNVLVKALAKSRRITRKHKNLCKNMKGELMQFASRYRKLQCTKKPVHRPKQMSRTFTADAARDFLAEKMRE